MIDHNTTCFAKGNMTTLEEITQLSKDIREAQRALRSGTLSKDVERSVLLQLAHMQAVHDRLALKI
jgi:hypothetical protein